MKRDETWHKTVKGKFGFGTKIKTTYPGDHFAIWTLALRSKLRAWQSHLYVSSKNSEFDHLDTTLPSPKCAKSGNETYWGPLWYWAWAIPKKRNFWNRLIFLIEINQNVIFRVFKINPFPCLPPYSRWFLWRYMMKNNKISKIWRGVFVFRPKNSFFRPKSWNYHSYRKYLKLAHFSFFFSSF